ncbi:MAG: deoxynucleoside kinase [Mycoplasmataceae bacterium]|nr:deoxynucleoside kinase [Mycoplasmataceae bacterium]
MFLVIGGTVGIGKSTVSYLLEKKLKEIKGEESTILEPEPVVGSPYLKKYYEDPVKWTLVAQLDFLLLRHKQLLDCQEKLSVPGSKLKYMVFDRHLLEDYIFANMHSTKKNMRTFNSLAYHAIYNNILSIEKNSKVDYFFLLKAPLDMVINRVKERGREIEMDVDVKYWQDLYDMYYNTPWVTEHFKEESKKLINIDATKSPEEIVDDIIKILKKDNVI